MARQIKIKREKSNSTFSGALPPLYLWFTSDPCLRRSPRSTGFMPMLPQSRYGENKSGRLTLPLKGIKYDVWQESKSLIEGRQNWSLTWGPLLDCHLPMNPLPPKHSLCPLPHFSFRQLVRGTSYFIQILEITTQPHWTTEWHSKITCSLPPYLFCACSTRKESSGLRKEATDEENISDKGTYRIEILKEKMKK